MGARSSLRRSGSVLTSTPSLVAMGLAYGVIAVAFGIPSFLGNPVLSILSGLGSLAFTVFGLPLFIGGFVGLAHAALRDPGNAGVGDFLESAKDNYLYLLGFTVVLGAIELVWGGLVGVVLYFISIFLVIAIVLGGAAGGSAGVSTVAIALGALVFVAFVLAFYAIGGLPALIVQFVPGAWVIEDRDPIDGVKRGVSLLTGNLKSVVGFDLAVIGINLVVAVLYMAPLAIVWAVLGPDALISGSVFPPDVATGPGAGGPPTTGGMSFSPLAIGIYALTALIVMPIQTGFLAAYYATFYDDIAGDQSRGDDRTDGATAPADWEDASDAPA